MSRKLLSRKPGRSNALFAFVACVVVVSVASTASARPPKELPGSLNYRIIAPPGAAADTPVVIAIHGLGDSADGFAGFVHSLRLPFRFVVPDAPHPFKRQGRSWYRRHELRAQGDVAGSTLMLADLVQHVRSRWPQAPKPFLLGFSQGGVMGYSMAANHPTQVSGVVAIAGYLIPNELVPARRKRAPPIQIIHGRSDQVVKIEEGREAQSRFSAAGYSVDFYEHKAGHKVPRNVRRAAREWLLQQAERVTGRPWAISN